MILSLHSYIKTLLSESMTSNNHRRYYCSLIPRNPRGCFPVRMSHSLFILPRMIIEKRYYPKIPYSLPLITPEREISFQTIRKMVDNKVFRILLNPYRDNKDIFSMTRYFGMFARANNYPQKPAVIQNVEFTYKINKLKSDNPKDPVYVKTFNETNPGRLWHNIASWSKRLMKINVVPKKNIFTYLCPH